MKLEVNLSKKYFFILLGAILVLAGAIYGYAQSPAIFGHDVSEIGGIPECSANQYLTFVDGAFLCETDDVGSGGSGGSVSIDYNDCSQITFSTQDNDDWLAHTCPTDMVLVGGAGCGGSYCGGLRYARCCRLSSTGTINGLSQDNCAWTEWFRQEEGTSPQVAPEGSYIAGIDYDAITGSPDGKIRFYYCDS
jgi:hypothetical protein